MENTYSIFKENWQSIATRTESTSWVCWGSWPDRDYYDGWVDVSALAIYFFYLGELRVVLLVYSEMCYKYMNISFDNWLAELLYVTLFIHGISMLALTQRIISQINMLYILQTNY